METLTQQLLDYGAIGLLAGVCIYQVVYLQGKIFTIIENNSNALLDLKNTIDKCHILHERPDKV